MAEVIFKHATPFLPLYLPHRKASSDALLHWHAKIEDEAVESRDWLKSEIAPPNFRLLPQPLGRAIEIW